MSYKQDVQSLILQFQKLKIELGRIPTSAEFSGSFVGSRDSLRKHFGTYEKLVVAAGFNNLKLTVDEIAKDQKLENQFKKICSTKTQIQGFFMEELSLPDLFQRAGNPAALKMTGQPDTHLKFVDVAAYRAYKKFIEWYQPDIDLMFGDYLDCEGISHWPSDSLEPRRLVPEIILGRKDLAEKVALTPDTSTRIFLIGNHEDWIRQSFNRMPEFFHEIDKLGYDFSLDGLLNLKGYGYQSYEVNHLLKIGKALFTHGIYCGGSHAKKHMSVFKANIYYGHLHDNQTYNETSIYGNLEAASMGCLARLDAKFLRGKPNNWTHGFGVWEFFPNGNYTRYFLPIFDGKLSFCGKVFDGNV
jgi:hypothetical protein